MIPVLFKLGPLTIYSYGLMMALGFLAADLVISAECRRRGITPDYATSVVVWGAIGGLAGARVYDVLDNFPAYMHNPWSIVFSGSGFVWYGGLIGGILTIYFIARHYRVAFLVTADLCAPALAIGQALGRVGCQLSGDGDWGLPSKLPWAMAYPHAIIGWNANTVLKLDSHDHLVSGFYPGVRVHPAPVYEAILYVGVFAFLWSIRKRNVVAGRLFYLYLVTAGAARFLVEFVRINPRVLWGLSEAQLIAIVMMVTGTAALLYTRRQAANSRPAAAGTARRALRA
jgi:phosphatidylglycerol---prolipoprotein diacylglyceryl transferase